MVKGEGTGGGSFAIDVFSKLVEERVIFLHEEIDSNIASNIIATLLYLDEQDSSKDITIYINSVGGDIDALFAIYDTFQLIASPIKTVAIGKAYSAAAVLLAAGTKGKRFICPNAQIMIHHIQVSEMEGSKKEVVEQVARLDSENKSLVEMLARHCGQPAGKVDEDCQDDKYFTAKEAVKYGIADKIMPMSKKPPPLKRTPSRRKKRSK
jgi:ATP-dependent Clp protease protease subunit